jgi:hypothetical protein
MDDKNEIHDVKSEGTREAASSQGDERRDQQTDQKTFLGQTAGTWYIYWICAVASIANIFQGFDSGIYTIIIAENAFIDRFNLTGSRQGAVASMISMLHQCYRVSIKLEAKCHSRSWKRNRKPFYRMVVHLVPWSPICFHLGHGSPSLWRCSAGWCEGLPYDHCWENHRWHWDCNVCSNFCIYLLCPLTSCSIGTNLAAYQAEVSSPAVRGRVVSFVQISYQVGVLIAWCIGLGIQKITSPNAWRYATALQVIPGLILIIFSFTIPESPRWLLEKRPEKPEIALKELARIRKLPKDDPTVQAEFFDLQATRQYRIEHNQDYTWIQFLSKYAIWRRIAYGMATMALGQISGIGALMLYGITVFKGLGYSSSTLSLLLNVVAGVLSLA